MRAALLLGVTSLSVAAAIPTDGLIGYFRGDGNSLDSSPTGNNGTFNGSYLADGPNGQKAFNLSTGVVVIPNNPAYNFTIYTGWTIGFWFNTEQIAYNGTNATFLGQDNGSGFQPKWLIDWGYSVYGPTQGFVFHVNDFNQERMFISSDDTPLPAGWNQLTVVIQPTAVAFYLNGQSIGTAAMSGYVLQTTAPLVFGQLEGLTFRGGLADVAIYDVPLDAAQVQLLAAPEPSAGTFLVLAAGLVLGGARLRRRATGSAALAKAASPTPSTALAGFPVPAAALFRQIRARRLEAHPPRTGMARFSLASATAVFLTAGVLLPGAGAQMTIQHGSISVGVDMGSSPIQAVPPAGPGSSNTFFASSDLTQHPSGSYPSFQGPAEGWAGAQWNIGGSGSLTISAAGSSIQGFNGGFGAGGYIYGWGHSSFDATVSLAQAYKYTASTPTSNVTGITGGSGILPADSYSFAGTSYGNSGGYSLNLALTPLSPAEQQILAGVNLHPTVSLVALDGGARQGISATFAPNGTSLSAAAAALGGDHFNVQQQIISVPNEWRITINGTAVKLEYAPLPAGGISDPPGAPSSKFILNAATGIQSQVIYDPTEPDGSPFSPNGSDYFSDTYITNLANGTSLTWQDTPSFTQDLLLPGESIGFRTTFVLEDKNDHVLQTIGAPIDWTCDQTTAGLSCHDSTSFAQPGLEPGVSGGIALGQVVPEPGGLPLLLLGCTWLMLRRPVRPGRNPTNRSGSTTSLRN